MGRKATRREDETASTGSSQELVKDMDSVLCTSNISMKTQELRISLVMSLLSTSRKCTVLWIKERWSN